MRSVLFHFLVLMVLGCSSGPVFAISEAQTQSSAQEKPKLMQAEPSPKQRKEESKKKEDGKSKGQEEANEAQDQKDVVRIDTTLIAQQIAVVDRQGNFIKDLTASDFIVSEDGQPQQLTTFASADDITLPRTIVLIIQDDWWNYLFTGNRIEAVNILIDKLTPRDRLAILSDGDPSIRNELTQDKAKLKKKLESLQDRLRKGGLRVHSYPILMQTLKDLSGRSRSSHHYLSYRRRRVDASSSSLVASAACLDIRRGQIQLS